MTETFIAAVLCIDGRFRRCLVDWLVDRYSADYVDLITEPGPDRILSARPLGSTARDIRRKLDVSLTAHAARAIVLVGHEDCAGNPVLPEDHRLQIGHSTAVLRDWYPDRPVLGVFVDSRCEVHVVVEDR